MDDRLIRKYALQNAVFYGGTADPKAVLGKVLAEHPELRTDVARIREEAGRAVSAVNALSVEEQKAELADIAPDLLERQEKTQEPLPSLPGAAEGRVVTRFAPSPTGPLNILHILRAVSLSYLYARKYAGTFILRFEDTDPKNIRKEFYRWIEEDLLSLGMKPDAIIRESDHLDEYYRYAEQLIGRGKAYVCRCAAETFQGFKHQQQDCPCRHLPPAQAQAGWNQMTAGALKEGAAVLRFKTSMQHPNPALRDPPLFRIVDGDHPLVGRRYHAWPLYNFANVVEDHLSGITHVFRGKEHEHNTGVQKGLYEACGWTMPYVLNFGMIYLPDAKVHTRDIRESIAQGAYSGWDDPRLHTVRALLRRGFHPDTFRQCALACGLSKTDIRVNWETIESVNRQVIDPIANRYMVVIDPVKLSLKKHPTVKTVTLPLHPTGQRGEKTVHLSDHVFISQDDFDALQTAEFRLKGLFNVKVRGKTASCSGDEIRKDMHKIQWVSEPHIAVTIVTPQGEQSGLGEPAMKQLRAGDLIQMERIGFGRVDAVKRDGVTVYFAHK